MSGATDQCPACGATVAPGERFCEACGHDLTQPAPARGEAAVEVAVPAVAGAGADGPGPIASGPSPDAGVSAAPPEACGTCGGTGFTDGFCDTCGTRRPAAADHSEIDFTVIAGVSDIGKRHQHNEDAMGVLVYPSAGAGVSAAVICDGVSSSNRPDLASNAAVSAAIRAFGAGLSATAGATDAEAAMHAGCAAAQAAAALAGGNDHTPNPPSTTLVAAILTPVTVTVGWIGDSRAYWLPGGTGHAMPEGTQDRASLDAASLDAAALNATAPNATAPNATAPNATALSATAPPREMALADVARPRPATTGGAGVAILDTATTTHPDTTEPDTTEPDTTEPDATEPDATEPDATEPATAAPAGSDAQPTDPDKTDPDKTDPDVAAAGADDPGGARPARLTVDDTLAGQLAAAGVAMAPEAPNAGALVRWLGADASDTAPHVVTFTPDRPGRIIVCSDGLYRYVPEPADLAAATPAGTPYGVASALVRLALDAGGQDNVSVIVMPFPPPPHQLAIEGNIP